MNKNLIVSSADDNYFKLLLELIYSIKINNKNDYDIAILDTGLSLENINNFEKSIVGLIITGFIAQIINFFFPL
jgi:lipopolysaccharide biosynthesis glycosyltransferase